MSVWRRRWRHLNPSLACLFVQSNYVVFLVSDLDASGLKTLLANFRCSWPPMRHKQQSGITRSSDKSVAADQFCSFWLAKYDKLATLEFK